MYNSSRQLTVTYIVIILNVMVYVYTAILSGNPIAIEHNVILQYGQANYRVVTGWYWQLFTALFVHVHIVHLFGNMFFLLIFGLRTENLFSRKEYLLIYFLSGLAGNLLTLVFGSRMVSAGASGAIFGLFGACTIYVRRTVGQSVIGALLYSFFLLMIGTGQNVNYLAHLGGLVVGLLIGYILAVKHKQRTIYEYSYSYPLSSSDSERFPNK